MLTIHYGNRLARLADVLFDHLEPTADPLTAAPIGLPSRLLGRWLSLRLAAVKSVAANLDLRLHAELVWHCFRTLVPELEQSNRFAPSTLSWRIYRRLEQPLPDLRFTPLRNYLAPLDARGRLVLAQQLATLYDRYLVYRPQQMLDWEQAPSSDDHWQGLLWQQLTLPHDQHWAKLSQTCIVSSAPSALLRLPRILHFFATPAFSPSFLDVLIQLGRQVDVHVYQWNPTPEYWGDLDRRSSGPQGDLFASVEHNELLPAWGQQLRECFEQTVDRVDDTSRDQFVPPSGQTLLGRLQRRIFDIESLRPTDLHDADDGSLRVHVCHSRRREIEVLHDWLLARFESEPALSAEDVLVVAPNLDDYAPYISAVFDSVPDTRRLPFQLIGARQPMNETMLAVKLLLRALARALSREQLLELLRTPAARRRWGFAGSDFAQLGRWLRDAGLSVGPTPGAGGAKFSWVACVTRLLDSLVVAEPEQLQAGSQWAPTVSVSVSDWELLGQAAAVIELLSQAADDAEQSRSLINWQRWFLRLLDRLIDRDWANEALLPLQQALADLVNDAQLASMGELAVEFAVFVEALERALDGQGAASYFSPLGGVQFCSAAVGRLLPAKIIYLLGLNDGEFPRGTQRSDLDLMTRSRQLGDRSARDDDRQLFLEWLTTAEDSLVLSYLGRSAHDLTPLAPSPLVTELLAHLDQQSQLGANAGEKLPSALLTTVYPLQPFAATHPDGEPHHTYAEQYVDDSRGGRLKAEVMHAAPAPPAEPQAVIELDDLLSFWRHPTRYYLRQILGLRPTLAEEDDEEAPVELTPLVRYQLRDQLLNNWDRSDLASGSALERGPALPEGSLGQASLSQLLDELSRVPVSPQSDWQSFDLLLPGQQRLRGQIALATGLEQDLVNPGSNRAKHQLAAWIKHLLCNHLRAGCSTTLHGHDGRLTFQPIAQPEQQLQRLVDGFLSGCREPSLAQPELLELAAGATDANDRAIRAKIAESLRQSYRPTDLGNDLWIALAIHHGASIEPLLSDDLASVWSTLKAHRS